MENLIITNVKAFSNRKDVILESELKFLIDKTIVSLFGILEAHKIVYSVKCSENSSFCIKTYKK